MPFTLEEGLEMARDTGDRCRPHFFIKAVKLEAESKRQGRAVFEDVEYVRIEIPGESKLMPVRRVADEDRARWPKSYEAFTAGLDQPLNGTPIGEWPLLSPAQVETYRAARIRTVEDLANLPDSAMTILGPDGFKLRAAARRFIAPAPVRERELQTALEERDARIAALEARINQLSPTAAEASPRRARRAA